MLFTVLEFIYAQSPESMKGLLSGLFYFFLGLTSIPSSALYYIYKDSRENRVLVLFHAAFTIIMVGNEPLKNGHIGPGIRESLFSLWRLKCTSMIEKLKVWDLKCVLCRFSIVSFIRGSTLYTCW